MTMIRSAILFATTLSLGLSATHRSFANPLVGTASSGSAVTATGTSGATGVTASSDSGYGLFSTSSRGVGVFGSSQGTTANNGAGIVGGCEQCTGVVGESTDFDGVQGFGGAIGVYGYSQTGEGVYGESEWNGVYGVTSSTSSLTGGVHGATTGAGNAVFAENSGSGTGLMATSATGHAIVASSGTSDAIVGTAGTNAGASGIWGLARGTGTYGVYSSGDLYVRGWSGTPGDAYKPGGGSWKATSDARVKKDVVNFTPALPELEKLRPVRFKYNGLGGTDDSSKEYVGVIAQDLEKVLPFMVSSQKRKLHESDSQPTDIKQVDPSAFTYVLINAVQELSKQNKELTRQVNVLNAQSKQMAEIAKLMCQEHPSSKPCNNALEMARLASVRESSLVRP